MSEKLLLQKAIAALQDKNAKIERYEKEKTEPIAVIGMGCRFPGGAVDPSSYWNILQEKKDAIVRIPAERWNAALYADMGISPDDFIPYAGLLDDVYHFDPHFFRISAREAASMDPQQRLLLEVGWEALEDAGQANKQREKETGIFIGITQAEYGTVVALADGIDSFFGTGNSLNVAAGRLAYVMGFGGPAMAVDTACSSSLVSVHLACQSLRNGECKQALAGGVNLILTPFGSVAGVRAQMLSKEGRCKTFDDTADGYVRGEGCGIIVLKRLSDAIKDKDDIKALIRASGVSQDGASSGLTVPNGTAQQQLISRVMTSAGIDPHEIDYIEAHGTGTSLGDPIELKALGELFKTDRQPEDALMIGSVKSNIGHLESAAGIAGLIKLILSLQHSSLTASLHFNTPNRYFNWEQYPIQVVTESVPWKKRGKSRIAGVSSFGFSGTIAHVVVEEAPVVVSTHPGDTPVRPQHLCCLTARSKNALLALLSRFDQYLNSNSLLKPEDVCHTVNTGRTHFEHRVVIKAASAAELRVKIARAAEDVSKGNDAVSGRSGGIGFVFGTDEAAYLKAAVTLYHTQPLFRRYLDSCGLIADKALATPLYDLIFGDQPVTPGGMQVVQFSVAYALAGMWQSWGLTPQLVIGQGTAHCAAACIAGVFSLTEALKLVMTRSAAADPEVFKPSVLPAYESVVGEIHYTSAVLEVYTSTTQEDIATAAYWAEWSPEHSADTIDPLLLKVSGADVLLEAGLTDANVLEATDIRVFSLISTSSGIWEQLVDIVATLYTEGWEIDWKSFDEGYDYRKISLPVYAFQRQQFIVEHKLHEKLVPAQRTTQPQKDSLSREQVVSILVGIMADLLKEKPADINTALPFLEMGADSIMLMEAAKKIENTFSLVIPIKLFFEELQDIDALSVYITAHIEQLTPVVPAVVNQLSPAAGDEMATSLSGLAEQVLSLNRQLVGLLNKQGVLPEKVETPIVARHAAIPVKPAHEMVDPFTAFKNAKHSGDNNTEKRHSLPPAQEKHLQDLVARLTQRTAGSKRFTAEGRRVLADNRASAGFRHSIKEMLYPIVGKSSKGARIWDIDGNEFLDISMGFGVNLFGHQPGFIEEAITGQLKLGMQLGPQSALAAEVADGITKLTGVERVSFCNSGTEAVMTALRLARTRTGRMKIAIFAGAYHGHFDGVLCAAGSLNEDPEGTPVAPGISPNMSRDIIVLDYDHPRSLELLELYASELAGILVEPVQSRRPHIQPREFLQALKAFTVKENIPLIFDEMITGFRIHPGGAQAYFDVKADLVTYGKIIGGGLPIGVVAGSAYYMDGIDGGAWQYGDASFPRQETTFFAGTFCKHPLTMAASLSVIKEMIRRGPALQESINEKTRYLAGELNSYFRQQHLPLEIVYFGSLFRFASRNNIDLLFYHLIDKGIYIWEGRNLFLSDAHTQADVELIILKVKESVDELVGVNILRSTQPLEDNVTKIPITQAQRQLWILSQLNESGSIAYNIPSNLELKGTLQITKLNEAINALARRHETLRTVFTQDGSEMIINTDIAVTCKLVDFSAAIEEEKQALLEQWNSTESRTPFDMNGQPLYRFHLIRLSADQHVLALTVHHALLDGWSVIMLLKEAGALYTSLCRGEAPALHKPMQYREFIELINNGDRQEKATAKAYWLNRFSDTLPVLELPVDFPRQARNTFNGKRLSEHLDIALMDDLKKIGQRYGATLFVTMLSAYTLLLRKLSGLNDFVIGIPSAGRFLKGSETVAGYCSHLLPIRSCFTDDIAFPAHLRHTRTAILEGFEHEHFYFAELVETLSERENMMNNPLARATFNMDPMEPFAPLHGLDVKYLPTPLSYVAYDCCLNVIKLDDSYELAWEYNTDLFEEATILRFSSCFKHILEQIVADSAQQVTAFSLLTPVEKATMQRRSLSNKVALSDDRSIHQLFEKSVSTHARDTAIVYREQVVTYQQLNERGNQWAHFLQEAGVDKHKPLVILLEKSIEMVAVMLGAWKAGTYFAAIDPSSPKLRLELISKESAPDIIITQHKLADALPQTTARIIHIENISDDIAVRPAQNIASITLPDDLAYIAYTSGSTGIPKGIMATHEGVINYLCYICDTFSLHDKDAVLQLAPAGFDASIRDIFSPLMAGATVIMGTDSREPGQILAAIREHRITCLLSAVPFMLGAIADSTAHSIARQSSIRLVMVSGEILSPLVAKKIFSWLGDDIQLVNQYGPTECTMTATFYIVQPEDIQKGAIPIGKPIPNMEVYIVVDEQLVPDGLSGEIWIGGIGVAKGYFKQPDLTAARFIKDPFSDNTDKQVYRTGDTGRMMRDGNIAFYGRIDNQVKIRGFRVELEEIAATIREYPGISACVAIYTTLNEADGIHAFLVTESNKEIDQEALSVYLKNRLPAYALPSGYFLADKVPLTTNGKIDRKRLIAIAQEMRVTVEKTAPRNDQEEKLVHIWKELLGKDDIGIHEDFFHSGGTSLKAIQLIGRLHATFNKLLSAADIFNNPTIGQLAELLPQQTSSHYQEIKPLPEQDAYELSHAQRRLWVLDQFEQQQVAYNISSMVTYQEELDVSSLSRAFETVVNRHESLRTYFVNEGGNPVQKILLPDTHQFSVNYVDLSHLEKTQQLIAVADAKKERPFALEQAPLLRVTVMKLAVKEYIILCSTHHIVSDGWSLNVLLNEVLAAYTAFRNGETPALPPLKIQYKDFAAWQNAQFQGGKQERYKSFWKSYFSSPLPLLELPYDKQRNATPDLKGEVISFELEGALTDKIKTFCEIENATLFMVLTAFVKVLLYRYSGQKEMIIGIPLSGRTDEALEGQIGFYISTVALRSVLNTVGTFGQFVSEIKDNFLKVMPYTVYPFDKIVEDLGLEHIPGRSSLFDVMVQIQDTHQVISAAAEAGFIREAAVSTNTGSSKFDLTFNFTVLASRNDLRVDIEYNTGLFFRSTIERMKTDFVYMVSSLMLHPDWSIANPGLLPQGEQQTELEGFINPTN